MEGKEEKKQGGPSTLKHWRAQSDWCPAGARPPGSFPSKPRATFQQPREGWLLHPRRNQGGLPSADTFQVPAAAGAEHKPPDLGEGQAETPAAVTSPL